MSNCDKADFSNDISVTENLEKCTVTRGASEDTMQVVRGSSAVFEEGTRTPNLTELGDMIFAGLALLVVGVERNNGYQVYRIAEVMVLHGHCVE